MPPETDIARRREEITGAPTPAPAIQKGTNHLALKAPHTIPSYAKPFKS